MDQGGDALCGEIGTERAKHECIVTAYANGKAWNDVRTRSDRRGSAPELLFAACSGRASDDAKEPLTRHLLRLQRSHRGRLTLPGDLTPDYTLKCDEPNSPLDLRRTEFLECLNRVEILHVTRLDLYYETGA